LRRRNAELQVEVLVPDFLGKEDEAMVTVLAAEPHVYNHNIETVRRIQPKVRIKGDYERALWILKRAKELWSEHFPERGPLLTKSGIIVGMGETDDEVIETMADLRANDVDVVTIGQYLQPSEKHLPLDRWVPLDSFRRFSEAGVELGFGSVFSGPLVRSSYRAEEQRLAAEGKSRVVAY
jgi:lipoic acid synthetase